MNIQNIIILTLFFCGPVLAQKTITLEECQEKSLKNYPLTRQRELVARSGALQVENATRSSLPQINLFGQASYQSGVTAVPTAIPGVEIPLISKDQYKLYLDLQQPLYDGGYTNAQKQISVQQSEVEKQKLETELYKLSERVQHLFFGILLINRQLRQTALAIEDIKANHQAVQARVENGVSLKSNAEALKAEILRLEQKEIELLASRSVYLKTLGQFMSEELNPDVILQVPSAPSLNNAISRPELRLYDSQTRALEAQDQALKAKNNPRFNAFVQAGFGRPALNMLSNRFEPYYIAGIRFSWALTNFYTRTNEKQILQISRDNIEHQKETFLFNTKISIEQDLAEANKFQELLQKDRAMLELRQSIKLSAKAQLENGTLNAADYLREAHAEEIAGEALALHEIQLLLAHFTQQLHAGKN